VEIVPVVVGIDLVVVGIDLVVAGIDQGEKPQMEGLQREGSQMAGMRC
jgi:hypothetical protein